MTAPTTLPASTRGRAIETRVGLETAVGTLAAAFAPMRMYQSTDGLMQSLVRDDKLGVPSANPRDLGRRRYGLPTGSVTRTVPININEIPVWLGAGFARTTTGSSPNYLHTCVPASYPSNTLSLVNKYASNDWTTTLGNALASIQIQAQKGEAAARAALTLIPLRDSNVTTAPGGTVASAYADDDFSDWAWTAQWNGVTMGDCTDVNASIDFGVERVQGLSGDTWPTMHHFGDVVTSGTFKLYGLGSTFRALAAAQTPGTLVLKGALAADPTNRFLSMTFNNAQMSRPQRVIGGPGQQSADFSFESSADETLPAVAIVVGNAIATY